MIIKSNKEEVGSALLKAYYDRETFTVSGAGITARYIPESFSRELGSEGSFTSMELSQVSFAELPAPWYGEGLPPVGMMCEIKQGPQWTKVEVTGYFAGQPVVGWICAEGECVEMRHVSELRAIRTPEQIAEEFRQRAVDEMVEEKIAGGLAPWVCAELYDAGYRKQVAP